MKLKPPPIVSRLQLIEISERKKILAGHDVATDSRVYVLRKSDDGDWILYLVPISELDQQLRSFLDPVEIESMELVSAIADTEPVKKKRRKRKTANSG